MAHYASFQAGTPNPETLEMTPAAREELHRQLTQPGKVIRSGDGTVTIEGPQSSPVTTRADRAAAWRDNLEDANGDRVDYGNLKDDTFVYTPDGDRVPAIVAKRAGLLKVDPASGRLVMVGEGQGQQANPSAPQASGDKPSEESDKKADDTKDEGWSSEAVDMTMATLGRELSTGQLEALMALAMTGAEDLPEVRALGIAQTLDRVSAKEVADAYRVMVQEARTAADAVVVKAGVSEPSELYHWLEKNDLNRAMSIRDAFARGQVKPLQQAAKEYAASHGSGISAADEVDIMASKDVHGGKLFYQDGVAMCEINGRRMSLREAVRQGFVRVS